MKPFVTLKTLLYDDCTDMQAVKKTVTDTLCLHWRFTAAAKKSNIYFSHLKAWFSTINMKMIFPTKKICARHFCISLGVKTKR